MPKASQAFVITHPNLGVYLGELGSWSLLDPFTEKTAHAFPSEEAARAYVRSFKDLDEKDVAGFKIVPVTPSIPGAATIADLRAAGLADMLGGLEVEFLRSADPKGNA